MAGVFKQWKKFPWMLRTQRIMQRVAECAGGIREVKALVFGGFHSADSAVEGFDMDMRLYYDGEIGLDYARLSGAEKSLASGAGSGL